MGGDFGPPVSVAAAKIILNTYPEVRLKLYGDKNAITQYLAGCEQPLLARADVIHASQVVEMDDNPADAIRKKKDSSMRKALQAIKDGEAQACVSAGNTGALMALARFVIKMIPGIDRPAIITALPTESGSTLMLDLGANVECDADTLFQFAIMGSILSSAVDERERPRVGLLNIGEEDIKGNDQVKQAAVKVADCDDLNYVGFVEGNDIFSGKCDVVVTDGFTGNNVLKASEGIVRLLSKKLRNTFHRNLLTKLVGLLIQPILKSFKREVDPDQYNGATLIGLQGIVIKSHGGASVKATVHALEEAIKEVKKDVPSKIKSKVQELAAEAAE
jgi:glycerol-3-phosphate acyltransferase PlsX